MANFNSTSVQNAINLLGVTSDGRTYGGRMRSYVESAEASAAAIADTFTMVRVQGNESVVYGYLSADALGSSVTLSVGDADDAAKYLPATSFNTANKSQPFAIKTDNIGEIQTGSRDIIVTVGGAAATGTIKLAVFTSGS